MAGPLAGVRVVELAALGPAPFAAMLLGDLGADVVRVDRIGGGSGLEQAQWGLNRNRRSIAVNLKTEAGREVVLDLVAESDVLIEGYRPGVAERLGVGPDVCLARNPGLVYGRMTGWGQEGPLSDRAGHDITYAAIAGALHPVGERGRPPFPPLNYVADFGGGSLYLVMGVLAALLERERSGEGQVVDAAMVDGAASLTAMFHGFMRLGAWTTERQSNLLDGGAPFYRCYETADGGYMAVGPIEPQFFAELCERLELGACDWPQMDMERWDEQSEQLAEIFLQKTRDEWTEIFAGSDACVAPVLALDEAPEHPHMVARQTFVDLDGTPVPGVAPRLSRTPGEVHTAPPEIGQDTDDVLLELGYDQDGIAELRDEGAVG